MILRTFLLAFLINAVVSDDTDDLIKKVFGEGDTKTTVKPPVTTEIPKNKEAVDDDGETCVCVPYYLCQNGTVNTDGTGLLNPRMGNICVDYVEECCKEPSDTPIMPPRIERKGCGQRHPGGVGFRITANDSEAQFGEFPWMVALIKQTDLGNGTMLMIYQCGGALIHESVILTAAHCVTKKEDNEDILARAGEWDTQRKNEVFPHQDRKVVRTIIHPGFQERNLWNDFALLVVDKPFEFAENVDTVCLPNPSAVSLSRECYASGWGKDKFGHQGQYNVILKKIDLPMVPKVQCTTSLRKTRLGNYFRLHDSFVCAGGVIGKDTCKGDGGSPLVCPIEGKPGTYEVTGLVAWGIGCGDETPGVYAGVAYARPWIDKVMAELAFTPQ